jgi:hypothetical protein
LGGGGTQHGALTSVSTFNLKAPPQEGGGIGLSSSSGARAELPGERRAGRRGRARAHRSARPLAQPLRIRGGSRPRLRSRGFQAAASSASFSLFQTRRRALANGPGQAAEHGPGVAGSGRASAAKGSSAGFAAWASTEGNRHIDGALSRARANKHTTRLNERAGRRVHGGGARSTLATPGPSRSLTVCGQWVGRGRSSPKRSW